MNLRIRGLCSLYTLYLFHSCHSLSSGLRRTCKQSYYNPLSYELPEIHFISILGFYRMNQVTPRLELLQLVQHWVMEATPNSQNVSPLKDQFMCRVLICLYKLSYSNIRSTLDSSE